MSNDQDFHAVNSAFRVDRLADDPFHKTSRSPDKGAALHSTVDILGLPVLLDLPRPTLTRISHPFRSLRHHSARMKGEGGKALETPCPSLLPLCSTLLLTLSVRLVRQQKTRGKIPYPSVAKDYKLAEFWGFSTETN
jgi:hypothetical protein